MDKIKIDGVDYDLSKASEAALAQLECLKFVNEQLLQRNNELQVAQTAKIGYSRALKRELEKIDV